jgi:ATP-dependent 26S proteasome regulatory subunit
LNSTPMVPHPLSSFQVKVVAACPSRKLLLCGRSSESHGQKQSACQGNTLPIQLSHEGKYVVNIDKSVKIEDIKPNLRVAVRSDNYILHKVLPTKVDPLVSLMKVEKVPDSTYDMIGGLDQQVKEVKEVI